MAQGVLRILLITGGTISTILGVVGIILPLLPTTPFLLLAAYCYARSSDTLYRRLLETKWLGTYIENFRSGKGIPLVTKWIAVLILWVSSFYSIVYIVPLMIIQLLLFSVVAYITYYIFSLKTNR
ncbi:DUF454 domain-containing protein [Salibacterium salarium]|uniref:DUF454 domain-containing protein n=1 Tax=Salibacterium salarium TaxID=284579 RepID=A0A428MVH8_9BACI|nr:YbaN family protein [Salibacterium salarium]RSL30127.1 DUF454 domain-containing protein [Salibacterium salarium]